MSVSMSDVRKVLDPEEPDYGAVAALGPDSLPHLRKLVAGDDPMLASKAAYAASLLEGDVGQDVVMAAAHSEDVVVRVAAASAASNLPSEAAEEVLEELVEDPDVGVRKVAASSLPDDASDQLRIKVAEMPAPQDTEPASGLDDAMMLGTTMPGEQTGGSSMPGEAAGGLMPGERPGSGATDTGGRMPGETG